MNREPLYCSFCAKSEHEVPKLIAGPTAYICNECVDLCASICAPLPRKYEPKHGPREAIASDFGFTVRFHDNHAPRTSSE